MKKILTTLIVVLAFYSLSHAQEKGNVEFGVNIGFNDSYVTDGSSGYNSSAVVGFNAGVSADYYFSDRWSLKVKAIYDQKGWGEGYLADDNGNEIDGFNFKVNYITVPVTASWHFARSRNWYLDFGPYIGFLTSAHADGYDVKNSFNSVDGGIALGIGVKFPISDKAKFFIEYNGQGSVSNVGDSGDGSNLQDIRESINVGINF